MKLTFLTKIYKNNISEKFPHAEPLQIFFTEWNMLVHAYAF